MFTMQGILTYVIIRRARRQAALRGEVTDIGGYAHEIFMDISQEELMSFRCNICFNVLKRAQACPNDHLFCTTCIETWQSSGTYVGNTLCPVCRADGVYHPVPEVDSQLGAWRVRCDRPNCIWTGELRNMAGHEHAFALRHDDPGSSTRQGQAPSSDPNVQQRRSNLVGSLAAMAVEALVGLQEFFPARMDRQTYRMLTAQEDPQNGSTAGQQLPNAESAGTSEHDRGNENLESSSGVAGPSPSRSSASTAENGAVSASSSTDSLSLAPYFTRTARRPGGFRAMASSSWTHFSDELPQSFTAGLGPFGVSPGMGTYADTPSSLLPRSFQERFGSWGESSIVPRGLRSSLSDTCQRGMAPTDRAYRQIMALTQDWNSSSSATTPVQPVLLRRATRSAPASTVAGAMGYGHFVFTTFAEMVMREFGSQHIVARVVRSLSETDAVALHRSEPFIMSQDPQTSGVARRTLNALLPAGPGSLRGSSSSSVYIALASTLGFTGAQRLRRQVSLPAIALDAPSTSTGNGGTNREEAPPEDVPVAQSETDQVVATQSSLNVTTPSFQQNLAPSTAENAVDDRVRNPSETQISTQESSAQGSGLDRNQSSTDADPTTLEPSVARDVTQVASACRMGAGAVAARRALRCVDEPDSPLRHQDLCQQTALMQEYPLEMAIVLTVVNIMLMSLAAHEGVDSAPERRDPAV